MVDKHGAWTTYGERLIYDNQWVQLGLVDVEAPNGERWEYHVVHLARIAIGLIVDERDRVLMLWRYRFPTDQWGYELLGGLVEDGEDPADTARREVEEETGYRPVGEPEHLVSFEPLPGQLELFVEQVVPILQARGLFRADYEGETFRDTLGLPVPENRYTLERAERSAA